MQYSLWLDEHSPSEAVEFLRTGFDNSSTESVQDPQQTAAIAVLKDVFEGYKI